MDLVVGRIVKSHGVRGEVVVDIRTDSPDDRFAAGEVLATRRRGRAGRPAAKAAGTPPAKAAAKASKGSARSVAAATPQLAPTLTVEAVRNHSGRLLVRFAGVSGREAADALRGVELVVDSESLQPLEADDEFYDHELEGLRVLATRDGEEFELGTVSEVLHTPAGEILSITTEDDGPSEGRDVLVPFLERFVPEVNVAAGLVRITPPAGLIELDAEGESDPDARAEGEG